MKKTLIWSAVIVAGCGSPGGGPAEAPNEEIMNATRFATDPNLLRVGQFGIYSCRVQGESQGYTTTMKVTGEDAEGLWIEQKLPGSPTPFIIKTHITRQGELIESWIGEPRGKPAKAYDRNDTSKEQPKVIPSSIVSQHVEVTRETITVAGRSYDCTKLISTITYSNGKTSTLIDWCSPEAPFTLLHEHKPVGGVVRRQYGKLLVELHSMGTNAREELVIPRK